MPPKRAVVRVYQADGKQPRMFLSCGHVKVADARSEKRAFAYCPECPDEKGDGE